MSSISKVNNKDTQIMPGVSLINFEHELKLID